MKISIIFICICILFIQFINCQTFEQFPVFDETSIPLTFNGYLPYNNRLVVGESIKVGDTEFKMTNTGAVLLHKKVIVWSPFNYSTPNNNIVVGLGSDGNLCTLVLGAQQSDWCTMVYNLNGVVLNILPAGSYGREWGIVIQTNTGKMVWGKFGKAISTYGNYPLVPGNYISSGNALTGVISNGETFLGVNQRSGQAIGFYLGRSPGDPYSNLVWSVNKTDTRTYQLFLKNNNVCIGVNINDVNPIWCKTLSSTPKYIIVPLPNKDFKNDINFWGWAILSEDKNVIYFESNGALPTYNKISIPLTTGASGGQFNWTTYGSIFKVGNVDLRFNSTGIYLNYKGVVAWSKTVSSGVTGVYFQNGMFCRVYNNYYTDWCSTPKNFGGVNINLLPEGSYGRQWGLVIQNDAGKMVWGEFGDPISTNGIFPLIPGSFIDRLDPLNNGISQSGNLTNGKSYLGINGYPYPSFYQFTSNNDRTNLWTANKNYFNPQTFNFTFVSDKLVCYENYCPYDDKPNKRYVLIPLPVKTNGIPADDGAWVILDSEMRLVFAQYVRPKTMKFELKSSNSYSSFALNQTSGLITFRSMLDSKVYYSQPPVLTNNSTFINYQCALYTSAYPQYYACGAQRTTQNLYGQQCLNEVYYQIKAPAGRLSSLLNINALPGFVPMIPEFIFPQTELYDYAVSSDGFASVFSNYYNFNHYYQLY